ncbi:uncharacterized protein LALA0_S06e08020g [Lachancea lanzarotensis]|uniref:LALA0S06e08020g1_1 n=1 Tax=Lachancea lanzarotensis TaxID=1245769 RepID=A0A0C7NBN4_9SACH|nr:uncharacterized protein LALA0_S06e08020g [Lachancea lanzarotensis]CEP62968.1 LALA0S06e08020g1_1 [Lachancea lanzarotensis]
MSFALSTSSTDPELSAWRTVRYSQSPMLSSQMHASELPNGKNTRKSVIKEDCFNQKTLSEQLSVVETSKSHENPFSKTSLVHSTTDPPGRKFPTKLLSWVQKAYSQLREAIVSLMGHRGAEIFVVLYLFQLVIATLAIGIKELCFNADLRKKGVLVALPLIPVDMVNYDDFTQYISN